MIIALSYSWSRKKIWSIIRKVFYILGRIWAKRSFAIHSKSHSRGVDVVAAVQPQENVYYHLSLETVLPALKLPRNCYITDIDSEFPNQQI